MEVVTYIITTFISILSILIAYLALKRNKDKDSIKEALDNGVLLSDISYIKKAIDRIEKRLEHVEIDYNDLLKRIITLEGIVYGKFDNTINHSD
jgi:hypothetical protein